jgi:hypothetical protein
MCDYDQGVDTNTPANVFVFSVPNGTSRPMGLAIEPWGDQCLIAPGDSVRLEMRGPEGGFPEVVIEPEGVTVFAWEGSTCNGWRGEEQVLHGDTPFPHGIDMMRRLGVFGERHRMA